MKKYVKNIMTFLFYFFYQYLFIEILMLFNINYFNLNFSNKVLYLLISNFIFIIILILLFKDELKKDLIDFKKNHKKYITSNIWLYLFGIFLMGLSNYILQIITKLEISGNEESVRELISKAPIYMFFSTIIFAPIVEELIFRKTIRNIISKKYLYIIIAGLIFGVLHISDYTDINQLLMGIPYALMGFVFAYIYYRTDNIFTTMFFHLIHNLILFIIQIL